MKVRIFALLAAFFMLMGGSAWAQSEVKGDVNKDGVVNEQDIAAILAIMAKNNGVAEKTKYYWYAGWTEPTEANIGNIIKETYPASKSSTTMNPAGKSATSTDGVVMDYNAANLYNRSANLQYYVVVPNGYGIYDSLGTRLDLDDTTFTVHSSTAIANHTIYRSYDSARVIIVIIKKIV